MSELEQAKQDIMSTMRATATGMLPDQDEKEFWAEIAADMATQKLKYAAAQTDDEKTRIANNLVYIGRAAETRLARKKLRVRNTAETIVQVAMKAAVNQFFPGAGALGELAKYVAGRVMDGQRPA